MEGKPSVAISSILSITPAQIDVLDEEREADGEPLVKPQGRINDRNGYLLDSVIR